MANYNICRPLKMGEIRSIRSNGGSSLNSLELLFSPTTIAKFEVNRNTNQVDFLIDNIDFKYQWDYGKRNKYQKLLSVYLNRSLHCVTYSLGISPTTAKIDREVNK